MYLSIVQFSQSIIHLSRIYVAVAVSVHSFIAIDRQKGEKCRKNKVGNALIMKR